MDFIVGVFVGGIFGMIMFCIFGISGKDDED